WMPRGRTRSRPTSIFATRCAFAGSPAGSRRSRWSVPCATPSSTGVAAREAPPDEPPCRHPGGREWDPALATLASEVTEAPARPPRPDLAAAVDLRAGPPADRERLRRHRTVPGGEHSRAAARPRG